MVELDRRRTATLRGWFLPERPGPLVGMHVIQTGHGRCWVDRWPNPRAVLVETGRNYALLGDPDALTSDGLRPHVVGFVEAQERFLPLLRETFEDMVDWGRVIFTLRDEPSYVLPQGFVIRRLRPGDAHHLEGSARRRTGSTRRGTAPLPLQPAATSGAPSQGRAWSPSPVPSSWANATRNLAWLPNRSFAV